MFLDAGGFQTLFFGVEFLSLLVATVAFADCGLKSTLNQERHKMAYERLFECSEQKHTTLTVSGYIIGPLSLRHKSKG